MNFTPQQIDDYKRILGEFLRGERSINAEMDEAPWMTAAREAGLDDSHMRILRRHPFAVLIAGAQVIEMTEREFNPDGSDPLQASGEDLRAFGSERDIL